MLMLLPNTLGLSSSDLFFKLIEQSNGVALNPNDVFVSTPAAKGRTATSVTLTAQPHSELKGTIVVDYERIDLNQFFFGIPITIKTSELIDKNLIHSEFLSRWNLNIDVNDFEINVVDFGDYLPKQVDIEIKEESLAWVGKLEAWVVSVNPIGDLFGKYDISFNTNDGVKRNAYLYSYEHNIQITNQTLIDYLEEGLVIYTLDEERLLLLNELITATGDDWVIDPTTQAFNLINSKVIYHDILNAETNEYLIVIAIGDKCSNLYGNLLLRYTVVAP